jgi:hypothetical protein
MAKLVIQNVPYVQHALIHVLKMSLDLLLDITKKKKTNHKFNNFFTSTRTPSRKRPLTLIFMYWNFSIFTAYTETTKMTPQVRNKNH